MTTVFPYMRYMFVIAVSNSPKCFKIDLIQYIYFCFGFEAFKTKLQYFKVPFVPQFPEETDTKKIPPNIKGCPERLVAILAY